MSRYGDPSMQPEPVPMGTLEPPQRREFGTGAAGILIVVGVVAGIITLVLAIIIFPEFLPWLIANIALAMVVIAILFVVITVLVFLISMGVGMYHLVKRDEVQGPEASYTLDMVKDPEREKR